MSDPLSPPPVTTDGRFELPAYVSNGMIGLRVLDIPLLPGVVLVNGFAGIHPTVDVEAAAQAPYPLAADLAVGKVWLRSFPQLATFEEQRYDFATGELTTRFRYRTEAATARVAVTTFCSRRQPTLAVQELAIEVDAPCELAVRAIVDHSPVRGRPVARWVNTATPDVAAEGALEWEALGGRTSVGIAYVTEMTGAPDVRRTVVDRGREAPLVTEYVLDASPGRIYRLRQLASLVPSVVHHDPDHEAIRRVCRAAEDGFDALRAENRAAWTELWKGRILIDADDDRWQRLSDAAFFYLNSSVHPSAPASTSIYGLAQWSDYHYYYGHVMWDIETFTVPPLLLLQPDAARGLLDYRVRTMQAARHNARLHGRQGLQFPWESGPRHGEETAPGAGKASWHEDHVSLDIAWAFAQFAHATGDRRFMEDDASRVLYGVADWLVSRVRATPDGFDIPRTMGIAERKRAADDDAFTVMAAKIVLDEAIRCADRLGDSVRDIWRQVAEGLQVRVSPRTGAVMSHDGYHPGEEKGATPGPLAGLFPYWFSLDPEIEQATLRYYLDLAPGYIGSPMLSPLYGVWACWAGDRRLATRLLIEGYAELVGERFLQTLEQSPTKMPDKPPSGPFFANLGGFLSGLLYGLPGIRVSDGDPATWPSRPVVLPAGWRSIEVERAWIHERPARIVATHGADRATIEFGIRRSSRAA
jgi:trehalose/maltose hydrolase-like predicted phosphorylase